MYHWIELPPFKGKCLALLPSDEPNPYSMRRIASIYRRSDGMYCSGYYYPHSNGHKDGNGAVHKTRRGGQRWIERQLEQFWEPPTIDKALPPPAGAHQ